MRERRARIRQALVKSDRAFLKGALELKSSSRSIIRRAVAVSVCALRFSWRNEILGGDVSCSLDLDADGAGQILCFPAYYRGRAACLRYVSTVPADVYSSS